MKAVKGGKKIIMTADNSSETMVARRKWHSTFQVLKTKMKTIDLF